MSTLFAVPRQRLSDGVRARSGSGFTLAAAVLGFFVSTLDALIVNIALPSIRRDLGGGMTGLQWVVDGYTLMFAALLLSGGALSDRAGARRAFAAGLCVFVVASAACGLAPNLGGAGRRAVRAGCSGRDDDAAVGLLGVLSAPRIGAARIIAMSRHEPRQKLACDFGATDIVTERGDDGVARIKDMTGGIGATPCWNASAPAALRIDRAAGGYCR